MVSPSTFLPPAGKLLRRVISRRASGASALDMLSSTFARGLRFDTRFPDFLPSARRIARGPPHIVFGQDLLHLVGPAVRDIHARRTNPRALHTRVPKTPASSSWHGRTIGGKVQDNGLPSAAA